eukprot:GHVR01171214.1.p2 GENE.GHVR01171214.1~~GHVR01171214.1.p2  ORF type:complete len:120 (+),score=9.13 GHVR01171214.1:1006-1365(+)
MPIEEPPSLQHYRFLLLPKVRHTKLELIVEEVSTIFKWNTSSSSYLVLKSDGTDYLMYLFPEYYLQGHDPDTSAIAFFDNEKTRNFVFLQNEKYHLADDQFLWEQYHPYIDNFLCDGNL